MSIAEDAEKFRSLMVNGLVLQTKHLSLQNELNRIVVKSIGCPDPAPVRAMAIVAELEATTDQVLADSMELNAIMVRMMGMNP